MVIDALLSRGYLVLPLRSALLSIAICLVLAAPAQAAFPYPDAQVFEAPCPGYEDVAGCTFPDGRIYVPTQWEDEDGRGRRAIVLHELGHLYANESMTPWRWHRFRVLTRTTRRSNWLVGERFADAYANCAIEAMPTSWRWMDGYGYEPSRRVHRRVCALIR